jgi:hypothetical protein
MNNDALECNTVRDSMKVGAVAGRARGRGGGGGVRAWMLAGSSLHIVRTASRLPSRQATCRGVSPVCVCVCVCVCLSVCVCLCVCLYRTIYIHTHTQYYN